MVSVLTMVDLVPSSEFKFISVDKAARNFLSWKICISLSLPELHSYLEKNNNVCVCVRVCV